MLYIYSYLFTLGLPVAPHQSENVFDESNLAVDDQSNTVTNVAATGTTVTSVTNQAAQTLVTPSTSRCSSISGRFPVASRSLEALHLVDGQMILSSINTKWWQISCS